jgi:YggT family protein
VRTFWLGVDFALFVFLLLLMGRLVLEWTRYFARSWWPSGVVAVGVEVVYSATDPPLRLLRRLVPPLRVGGVAVDLSTMILLIMIWVARGIVLQLA